MNRQYYLHINGNQIGPLPYDQLLAAGLTPQTKVWFEGAPGWVDASTVPELRSLFTSQGPTVAPGMDAYQSNTPTSDYPAGWVNWMPWAIVGTILGGLTTCLGLIFGIIGMSYANKANKMIKHGFLQEAIAANSTAKTMTILSLVLAGIGIIGSIIFLFIFFPLSMIN